MNHSISYIAPLVLMLTACGGTNGGAKSTTDSVVSNTVSTEGVNESSPSEEIRKRLTEIYDDQFSGMPLRHPKILSDELSELMARVSDIEEAEGEIVGWDFNPWTLAQDYDNPTMTIDDIEFNEDGSAMAHLTVSDMGKSRSLIICMVEENNEWVAYDFIIPDQSGASMWTDYMTIVNAHNNKTNN